MVELESAAPPQAAPVLEAVAVSKIYPGSPPVHALHEVTVSARAGQHVALVGRSGSGKSTLLNLLGLLDRPTSGEVRFAGADTGALGDRDCTEVRAGGVGFVFQSFHLLDYRTAAENVEVGLLHAGVPRRERRVRALEALDAVGLSNRAYASPSTLSGGEKQRVAIARAIGTRRPRLAHGGSAQLVGRARDHDDVRARPRGDCSKGAGADGAGRAKAARHDPARDGPPGRGRQRDDHRRHDQRPQRRVNRYRHGPPRRPANRQRRGRRPGRRAARAGFRRQHSDVPRPRRR